MASLRVWRPALVLDVETRIDETLLRRSARGSAPRGIPPGLQVLTAGAMLAFEQDPTGACRGFALRSASAAKHGERFVVRIVESELRRIHEANGLLVTFNGQHDLAAVRLAALRLREFHMSGAATWMAAGQDRHLDLMMELGDAPIRWPRLADLGTALGAIVPGQVVLGAGRNASERAKCELDAVLTLILHLHLLSESARSDAPLRDGLPDLRDTIASMSDGSPHLLAVAESELMKAFAT